MGRDCIEGSLNMEIEVDEDMVQRDGCESPTNDFNTVIGHIEDIVISDNFQVKKNTLILIKYTENENAYC